MRILLYRALQCTWGVIQTFIGLCVFAVNFRERHRGFHGAVVTEWKLSSGISLGLFVFVAKSPAIPGGSAGLTQGERSERLLAHEYGHTIQSLLLGPLYLPIIGIPSILWAGLPVFRNLRRRKHISYYSFYTERWADYCGEKVTNTNNRLNEG